MNTDEDILEQEIETILLDAEPDIVPNALQVNFFLLFLVPIGLILNKICGRISIRISRWFFLPSSQEKHRILQSDQIKSEMKSLSVVDDFAAYSRMQRKLNMLTLNLEADALSRANLQNDLARMIKLSVYGILGVSYLFILVKYGTTIPVLILPSDWFYPFGFILSYPTGILGAVSLPIWTLLIRTVLTPFF